MDFTLIMILIIVMRRLSEKIIKIAKGATPELRSSLIKIKSEKIYAHTLKRTSGRRE